MVGAMPTAIRSGEPFSGCLLVRRKSISYKRQPENPMQRLFPLLLALLASIAFAQAPKSKIMPQDNLPTAILIAESPIAADGGSMLLQTQTASGKKRSYLRLRSLDAQGTTDYNRLTDDSGHTLTAAEKAALFARLRELRPKLDDSGKHYLDNFLDETPR